MTCSRVADCAQSSVQWVLSLERTSYLCVEALRTRWLACAACWPDPPEVGVYARVLRKHYEQRPGKKANSAHSVHWPFSASSIHPRSPGPAPPRRANRRVSGVRDRQQWRVIAQRRLCAHRGLLKLAISVDGRCSSCNWGSEILKEPRQNVLLFQAVLAVELALFELTILAFHEM